MTRLVTPEGTRAVVDHDELLGLSSDTGEVERILDQLVRARLIHLHTDPEQGATVEIVHEMLITEWPTLARWLEDSQAMRGFMHELRQATKQWASRGKPARSRVARRDRAEALATRRSATCSICRRSRRSSSPRCAQQARARAGAASRVFATIFIVARSRDRRRRGRVRPHQRTPRRRPQAEKADGAADKAQQREAATRRSRRSSTRSKPRSSRGRSAEKHAERDRRRPSEAAGARDAGRRKVERCRRKQLEGERRAQAQRSSTRRTRRRRRRGRTRPSAKKATEEAKAAKARRRALLAEQKRAELENGSRTRKKDIDNGDLRHVEEAAMKRLLVTARPARRQAAYADDAVGDGRPEGQAGDRRTRSTTRATSCSRSRRTRPRSRSTRRRSRCGITR